ncbi:MAG: phosphoribosyl-AMP cyclohydrolase [Rhodothermaceae bacterium]|nr:phosphoribosyl-AMP cyclohydrolase [Rhodothermaceae bacterium]
MNPTVLIEQIKYNADGLVTAIAQDHETKEILMLAYMNEHTVRQTLETGIMTYWSRSRQKVWVKGESSGNTQIVKSIYIDCDGDALLFLVDQIGDAACHTGKVSCFYRKFEGDDFTEVGRQVFDPNKVYGK